MSSSPSLSPAHSVHTPIATPSSVSEEEAKRQELKDWMRSSPCPQSEEQLEDDPTTVHPVPAGDAPSSPDHSLLAQTTPARADMTLSLQDDLSVAHCQASRFKLHPYQHNAVDKFVKATPIGHQAELFIAMCALNNKLDAIVAAAPAFSILDALMENIKSYVIVVLLSSKLSAYKGTVSRDHVIAIIQQCKLHIPDNFDRDHHAEKELKAAVQQELMQARSKVKKDLKTSIAKDQSIFALATRVVGNTQCSVTVPLCARLALLQKLHGEKEDSKYWDAVDVRLEMICTAADKDVKKITKAFANILKADHSKYGINMKYTIADSDSDVWQQSVDEVIVGDFELA